MCRFCHQLIVFLTETKVSVHCNQIGIQFFFVLEQIILFNPQLLFNSHYTCQSKALGSRIISPRRKDFRSFDVEVEDLKSVLNSAFLYLYICINVKKKSSAIIVQFFVAIFSLFFLAFCTG